MDINKVFKDHYSLLVEHIKEGIIFYDIAGIIINVNNRFSEMIGYSRDEIIGNHITDFLGPVGRIFFQQDPLNNNYQESTYLSFIKKGGNNVDTSISISCVSGADGCAIGNLAVIADITELRQTTERLRTKEEELNLINAKLEEINVALRVLLEKNTENKKTIHSSLSHFSFNDLDLTCSELQIAKLVKEGKSTKEIADILNISERTVDTHRFNIRKKIGISKQGKNLRSHLLLSK